MRALNSLEDPGNDRNQFFRLKRLCNIRINPGAETCNAIGGLILRCQKYNWDEPRMRSGTEISRELIAVHTRHADIANDQIGQSLGNTHESFRAASCCNDNVSLGSQRF